MVDITPEALSQKLGQKFPPSPQQALVIGGRPHGATLVVAGAGAGKTETMAARVVWLVANGYARPEEVLGLTFTRKAAAELGVRIRSRLQTLARSEFMDDLPADDLRREWLTNISPAVSTYDAYAGDIVREYGLLIPVEPSARLITDAERWMISRDLLNEWNQPLNGRNVNIMISALHHLSDEMDNHLVTIEQVREETEAAIDNLMNLEPSSRMKGDGLTQENMRFLKAQEQRLALLPVVEAYRQRLRDLNVMTFGQQMSLAAQMVQGNPLVGQEQRRRFRVVMLDEYQDTGHAQRVLLRSLFGQGQDDEISVTAVGDPMQSIYMFRGATASNLEKFRRDFASSDGQDAEKLEMTVSWRNPKIVLDLANVVSGWSMEENIKPRLVSRLDPGPKAQGGQVHMAFFDHREEELDWLADKLQQEWDNRDVRAGDFNAAVLVTKNADAVPIYHKLVERGVPAEMSAGMGLLNLPEVADVFAMLCVLVDPDDDVSTLRVLTGPRWNIGASDLHALLTRAKQLYRQSHRTEEAGRTEEPGSTEESDTADMAEQLGLAGFPEQLIKQILAALPDYTQSQVSLADALADVGDATEFGFSDEGAARIKELSAEIGYLRRHSLSKSLVDLVADIEQMMGVRTEVLTRWHRDPESSIGTSHLDQFASVVRSFAEMSSGNASDLVAYLRAARDQEDGLEPGEVQKRTNTVQILTVHKSKGLEWDIVAVVHADRKNFPDAEKRPKVETWVSNPARIPSSLRGDAELDPLMDTMPVLQEEAVDKNGNRTRTQHATDVKNFVASVGCFEAKERDRLFYVAITRTERVLYVSGSAYNTSTTTGTDPSVMFTLLRDHCSQAYGLPVGEAGLGTFDQVPQIDCWSEQGAVFSETAWKAFKKQDPPSRENLLMWPSHELNERRMEFIESLKDREADPVEPVDWPRQPDTRRLEAQEIYRAAARQPRESVGEQAQAWDTETDLLIEEYLRAEAMTVTVPLDIRVTATEAVALKRDPEEFARRRRRPIPMEPQPYAKRGTAFHNWLESYFGQVTLLDEDQLPGAADATLSDPQLETLKGQFLASAWKDRTPYAVEGAYSVTLAGRVFEGRIDAIFKEGTDPATGWMVVDWKTGRKPRAADMDAAVIQLAVYRLAWAKVISQRLGVHVDPSDVRAAFHYVSANETFEPKDLPDEEQLRQLLVFDGAGK